MCNLQLQLLIASPLLPAPSQGRVSSVLTPYVHRLHLFSHDAQKAVSDEPPRWNAVLWPAPLITLYVPWSKENLPFHHSTTFLEHLHSPGLPDLHLMFRSVFGTLLVLGAMAAAATVELLVNNSRIDWPSGVWVHECFLTDLHSPLTRCTCPISWNSRRDACAQQGYAWTNRPYKPLSLSFIGTYFMRKSSMQGF